jgi:hypothetical protein
MKFYIPIIIALLLTTSCQTPCEKKASLIHSGMTMSEVRSLLGEPTKEVLNENKTSLVDRSKDQPFCLTPILNIYLSERGGDALIYTFEEENRQRHLVVSFGRDGKVSGVRIDP